MNKPLHLAGRIASLGLLLTAINVGLAVAPEDRSSGLMQTLIVLPVAAAFIIFTSRHEKTELEARTAKRANLFTGIIMLLLAVGYAISWYDRYTTAVPAGLPWLALAFISIIGVCYFTFKREAK